MGKIIQSNLPCPDQETCQSSDAFTVYQKPNNGKDGFCFSCNRWFPLDANGLYKGNSPQDNSPAVTTAQRNSFTSVSSVTGDFNIDNVEECLLHPIRALTDRGITHATCERYGVRIGVDTRDGQTPVYHLYPVFVDGELTGFTQRILPKQFKGIGDCKSPDLFGANVINQSGKKLFITEGQLDCLSLYQVLKEQSTIDWEPSVVSLPNGTSAVAAINRSMELINNYEQIILAFDQDTAGKKAAVEVCKLLAGKVFVAKFSEKDPNDMLTKNKSTDLKWSVLTNAKKYQPDGVINGKDCWQRYKHVHHGEYWPYPDSMPGLNEKLYGIRPSEIVTVAAGTGIGKTQFLRELKYWYLKTTDLKIADISLEEDLADTIAGMLSLELNKRITLPDVIVSEEEEQAAFEAVYGSGRIELYDFFGGMDDNNLFSKLRYLIYSGCKLIFLDHLSIIISEYAVDSDERKRIDQVMTKLSRLVKETGASIVLVVHLSNPDNKNKSFEEGAIPTLNHLRGSGAIKQFSWDVIGLSRNQQHPDPLCANTLEITSLKCRRTGRTGSCGFIRFDNQTGRYHQTAMPLGYKIKNRNANHSDSDF